MQEYLTLANDVVLFNEYENMQGIKAYNRKVTRMRKIATEIERDHPTLKNDFCELLSHENSGIRLWVAHHVLEVMNCDRSYRIAALREIRYKAKWIKLSMALVKKCGCKIGIKSIRKIDRSKCTTLNRTCYRGNLY